jgi:hypothetical protein
MVIAIIGSRTFNNYTLLKEKLAELNLPVSKVVSGEASGADTLGKNWALKNGIEYQGFPADWDNLEVDGAIIKTNKQGKKYNSKAGFLRNRQIVDNADIVIAFWDMKSSGTKDSLTYAHKIKKRWVIIDISKFV